MQAAIRRLVWAGILVLAIGDAAAAQDVITIAGTVTTRADGLSVPGATVSVIDTTITTTTDTSGRYALEVPRSVARGARIQLKVDAPGLPSKVTDVAVSSPALTVDVGLTLAFAEQVTVGSRTAGADAQKAVPVDVITQDEIAATGYAETAQVIQAIAPSFNFPRPTITDGTDTVRPATLRGLGPDQVLVLVNGKRRHQSALVHLNGSIGRGSTGVDLNAIPVSAIDRIEVLRDGAAAQYGSDAIAGVINIVLKGGVSRAAVTSKFGMSKGSFAGNSCEPSGLACSAGDDIDFSDGGLFDAGGSWGLAAGKGTVTVAAEYRHHNRTNRASFDPRDQVVAGDAASNAVAEPNHRWGDPDTRDVMTFLNANVPLNGEETRFLYGFAGYSRRTANSAGFYRRALDARNWPQIYPLGFLPVIEPTVVDASGTAGVRGLYSKWTYDASGEYGHNSFGFTIGDTLNVSLGPSMPPNKTQFDAGTLELNQFVGNIDVSRPFAVANLAGPVNIAFGGEYRHENYQIHAGEPDSYGDGGLANQFGARAAIGAQVFPGFRPSNEVDASRNSVAGYVDVEGDVIKWLRLGLAGRAEHYDDFGGTLDGKLTVRVQPDPRFVIRGSISTGFRAPSLGQSFFSSTATNFVNLGQGLVPVESLTLPVGSAPAQVLGAQPLKPENSLHTSGGVAITPLPRLDVTIDFYRIAIDDRIVLSGNFTAAPIAALLAPFGANSARFFTNAIDTRTNGVDVTANYHILLDTAGDVRLRRRVQQHTIEDRRVRSHASAAGRVRVGPVRSDRAASDRVRAAEGQPASGRRLASEPAWRQSRRSAATASSAASR